MLREKIMTGGLMDEEEEWMHMSPVWRQEL